LPAFWSARLRRLLPSLVLALWLAPQLLLAGHGHWASNEPTSDCEICVQLAASTPAVNTTIAVPTPIAAALIIDVPTTSRAIWRTASVACRGPPAIPHHSIILQISV